jgi:twitching motility protein PilJ
MVTQERSQMASTEAVPTTGIRDDDAQPTFDTEWQPVDAAAGVAAQAQPEPVASAPADPPVAPQQPPAQPPLQVQATASGPVPEGVTLPVLGTRSVQDHQRWLSRILGASLVVLAVTTFFSLQQANRASQQVAATGQALMQSQRLAKSVSQALVGSKPAFAEVKDSSSVLLQSVRGLRDGSADIAALGGAYQGALTDLATKVEQAEQNATVVLAQEGTLLQVADALRAINTQSSDMLETAETINALQLQRAAPTAELAASSQLVMLTQRIGKSANEFLTMEGVSPEAVFLLGKDLNTFQELIEGLSKGSDALRLGAARDPQVRERLEALRQQYDTTRTEAAAILGNLQALVGAREAQQAIIADSEPLRLGLQSLQDSLAGRTGLNLVWLSLLVVSAGLALVAAAGVAYVQLLESRQRQKLAEYQRLEALAEQHDALMKQAEAKRINDQNQEAILRLMDELQQVAEGDLTRQATVTEDITGAIADTVNYTVEELRSLVASVQGTATRVAQTTSSVEQTSGELLQVSTEQLREIRETGQSVLQMADRITEVSSQAQQSAEVARQSLQAAASGLNAVHSTIGGMNTLRDQIQDTAKRLKRLGESSQEIGEITELISDITEQTNVLALNAAIQAASAGEAGRGFSVVAEEVQRLAERSADATRQIAALVKTIQTDTQDAVAAMEKSTQGVVEGARLSDNAGTALTEIDQVSRRLAELIEQIAQAASREAASASTVADNIQHIFVVTEQTERGTQSTAEQVRALAAMAEELRQSVARFKIA